MAIIDDFKARFPEFDDAVVDQWLPILETVWPSYYGRPYDDSSKEAILNLIAHLLTIEIAPGGGSFATKGVASQSVGSVSESYVASTQSGYDYDFYGWSKYGQRFMLLTARFRGPVFV